MFRLALTPQLCAASLLLRRLALLILLCSCSCTHTIAPRDDGGIAHSWPRILPAVVAVRTAAFPLRLELHYIIPDTHCFFIEHTQHLAVTAVRYFLCRTNMSVNVPCHFRIKIHVDCSVKPLLPGLMNTHSITRIIANDAHDMH